LVAEVRALLNSEGFAGAHAQDISVAADMKYVGQMSALPVPMPDYPAGSTTLTALAEAFAQAHQETYGYRSDGERLQLIALRVVGRGIAAQDRFPARLMRAAEKAAQADTRRAYFGPEFGWRDTPVLSRSAFGAQPQEGPVIVEEYDCTTVVRPGWRISRDEWHNMIVQR